MNGLPHLTHLRSTSLFGISSVTMIFDDDSNDFENRQQVLERLSLVSLPANLSPQIGPDYSPVGQIYFYTLQSTDPRYDIMTLKSLQDWVVLKQLKAVPDVADVDIFGGMTREYQVQVDPNKLIGYGLSIAQVEQALAANNVNAGGSFVERGQQAFNVRVVGLMQTVDDVGATVLKAQNGTPVRVRDVAAVTQGAKIRLGKLGKALRRDDGKVVDDDDVVEGIVLLRKGADAEKTLVALHEKVDFVNRYVLPPGVKIIPYLDRSDLVGFTTHTVLHNLGEGIILVVVVLFLFLGNLRSALIVALTIPFSLLFASILLDLRHIPANLLSLGALDFGMVVDGSVVMVENILRHLQRAPRKPIRVWRKPSARPRTRCSAPFSMPSPLSSPLISPFSLWSTSRGDCFTPWRGPWPLHCLGAIIFAMLLAPVLASYFFRGETREWRNPVLEFITRVYRRIIEWTLRHRALTLTGGVAIVAATFALVASGLIGSEFLPHLDEGAIWARGTLAPSTGPSEGIRIMNQARLAFSRFPEVTKVVSQVGRPDDGTDATGFFNTEYFIDLKPHDQWRKEFHKDKELLIASLDDEVEKIPGTIWNFSQPISDNMEEAVSGVKGELAVKIMGNDLKTLEAKADEIVTVMQPIPGVADLGIFRVLGQPNLNLIVDRAKADRYAINVADIQDAIETAVGGKAVSAILIGEESYDLVVRYQAPYRTTAEDIANIRILAPSGERVSLGQLCDIRIEDGASMIYRENNSRYIAIKYSVRGRDLGSTVRDAIHDVSQKVKLPTGYTLQWAGEYASQQRANARLALIVPITVLLILLLLYTAFGSFNWSLLIMATLATAPIGGMLALLATGTHFSVSSGIGMLALFGVSVQVGLIMIQYINRREWESLTS